MVLNINGKVNPDAPAEYEKSLRNGINGKDTVQIGNCLKQISNSSQKFLEEVNLIEQLYIKDELVLLERVSSDSIRSIQKLLGKLSNSNLRQSVKKLNSTGDHKLKKRSQNLLDSIDQLDDMTCVLWHISINSINNILSLITSTLNVLEPGSECVNEAKMQFLHKFIDHFIPRLNANFGNAATIDEYLATSSMLSSDNRSKVSLPLFKN